MKQLLFLLFFLPLLGAAQDADSTAITDTFTVKQKYVLHFLAVMDWSNTDVINLLNEYRPQQDSLNDDHPVTITAKGGMVASGMIQLGQLEEGPYADFNSAMLNEIFPQVKNPWLINQMLGIRQQYQIRLQERLKKIKERAALVKPLE